MANPFYISSEKYGYWQLWPSDADGAASRDKFKGLLEQRGIVVEIPPVVERWMRISNYNNYLVHLDFVLSNVDREYVKRNGQAVMP